MLITIMAFDKPGAVDLRLKTRAEHIEWIKAEAPKSYYIGPFFADDGSTMIGSLWVTDFPDLETARAFAARDPYAKAGLFEKVVIQPTRNVAEMMGKAL